MKNRVEIIIKGPASAGKTTLAHAIKQLLQTHGLNCRAVIQRVGEEQHVDVLLREADLKKIAPITDVHLFTEPTAKDTKSVVMGWAPMPESKTPFLDFIAENDWKHQDATYELESVMRHRGWEHTSSTPGCVWMWQKELPGGRVAIVPLATAVHFETELCGEFYPEDGR